MNHTYIKIYNEKRKQLQDLCEKCVEIYSFVVGDKSEDQIKAFSNLCSVSRGPVTKIWLTQLLRRNPPLSRSPDNVKTSVMWVLCTCHFNSKTGGDSWMVLQ